MKKNKIILKHCPNFYKIINFEFADDDRITSKLIEIYKDYIFNINIENNDEVKLIEKLDLVLNKYLDDYYFRREMQRSLVGIKVKNDPNNFVKSVVEAIINAFESYEMGYTRNIYFARWI